MNLRIIPGVVVTFVASIAASLAQETFEEAPSFRAVDLLPAPLLESPRYRIDDTVTTDGLLAVFQLRTDFGDFECRGMEMLHMRLHELRALEQIADLNKTDAFLNAAKNAAVAPVKSVVKIVSDPVASVKEVPKGVGRLFGRVVKGVGQVGKEIGKKVETIGEETPDGPKPPPKREDFFGYNEARNKWARYFLVDPYTSNEVLAAELSKLARLTFGTEAAVGFGIGAVAAPLNMIGTVDELVLTQSPAAVREVNSQALARLGVRGERAEGLLGNPWFTPTLQTRFVRAFASLANVRDAGVAVTLSRDVQSEDEARFLCRGLELLGRCHAQLKPLAQFHAYGRIPAASAQDGSLVVAAPVDVIAWTARVAEFAAQHEQPDVRPVLCTSGRLTRRANDELKARGWEMHTRFLDAR